MNLESILVQNLLDAYRQINQFLGLGLVASLSAFALAYRPKPSSPREPVSLPGGIVSMSPEHAQLVLLGICFVAGLMGFYAAESAKHIVILLKDTPNVLSAVCTAASVATAPVGIPLAAAVLPVIFVTIVFWRMYRNISEFGVIVTGVVVALPYFALALVLTSTPCRAS